MIKNNKILAIIPARGGSKRISKKNIKILAGKPLISYTIEAALKSKYIERIIVSTEDKEIAEISQKYSAEVIKRPKKLATDEARTMDVVFHVLDVLEKRKYIPQLIILLQPTSPLNTSGDIDKAVDIFFKNRCESVASVCEIKPSPYYCLKIKKKYLKPLFKKEYFLKRSQDLPKVYIHNGAIFISRAEIIKKYKSFYADKILPYIMPFEKSINIDNEIDFKLAESILINKNEKNKNSK